MENKELPDHSTAPVQFQEKDGALVPYNPPGEDSTFLERAAKALGVKDTNLAVMLMSQFGPANYKFSPENMTTINGSFAAVKEICPRDPVESMLAAQMVTVHSKIMDLMERAAGKDNPLETVENSLKLADRLMRTYSRQLEVLAAYRRKGKQSMTIKHVTVEEGGKAIVGNIGEREGR